MNDRRILFAGTPVFARAALAALLDANVIPITVLTQPDRPAGRGKRLTESPVKSLARDNDIDVLQPQTLRDDATVATLKALRPDLLIVAAYGLLLPQAVLDIPRMGCLNIHASLLPRWRGAAPIQAAILAGDQQSGISLMQMNAGMDTGPVFATRAIDISANETAASLHDRLADLGGEFLVEKLPAILSGSLLPSEQIDEHATHAGKIKTADALIDWQRSAEDLERRIRAYNPVPGAHFFADDLRIKCWQASVVKGISERAGTVVEQSAARTVIACGVDALSLDELQLPGKRRATPREFANQCNLDNVKL